MSLTRLCKSHGDDVMSVTRLCESLGDNLMTSCMWSYFQHDKHCDSIVIIKLIKKFNGGCPVCFQFWFNRRCASCFPVHNTTCSSICNWDIVCCCFLSVPKCTTELIMFSLGYIYCSCTELSLSVCLSLSTQQKIKFPLLFTAVCLWKKNTARYTGLLQWQHDVFFTLTQGTCVMY